MNNVCLGCGWEIDPETCHCGEAMNKHHMGSGHSPVPAGCTCGYHDAEKRKNPRVQEIRDMEKMAARQQLESVEQQKRNQPARTNVPNHPKTTNPWTTQDELGKQAWSLKCLVNNIRTLQNKLSTTEQNQHLDWAVRHLEDAQNQIELARTQT